MEQIKLIPLFLMVVFLIGMFGGNNNNRDYGRFSGSNINMNNF